MQKAPGSDNLSPEQKAKKAALDMVRTIFEDGEAKINGRIYTFNRMTHKQRRKVLAFYSRVAGAVQRQDFSFIDAPDFEPVESVINDVVTFDGSLLSRLGDEHWEKHPGDYLPFLGTALPVISFPFFPANVTD
jgi:hypothetical protein